MNKTTNHNSLVQKSIKALPQQILDGLSQWSTMNIKKIKPKQIIVCGMGGSALAADVLRYALWDQLSLPVVIVNNYQLPAFVAKDSLVIIVSYSGTTEEAAYCLRLCKQKKFTTVVMTSGNRLARQARGYKFPVWQFVPRYNYSGQPRYGLGYTLAGIASMLSDVLSRPKIRLDLENSTKRISVSWPKNAVLAGQLGKQPILIVASEHLLGCAHTAANQFNESSKRFAVSFALPELNHHLLEGLAAKETKGWNIIFLESNLYFSRTQKRYLVTQSIVKKLGLRVRRQKFNGSRLVQALSALSWSSAFSLELGQQGGYDAMAIPFVNELKRRLS